MECLLLTFVTVTIFYFTPYFARDYCVAVDENWAPDIIENLKSYKCTDGYFNPIASLVF